MEIEEIAREPAQPPRSSTWLSARGDEFDMLEEGKASAETKRLRADLSAMISRIEVSLK